jgi:hypothetical protein
MESSCNGYYLHRCNGDQDWGPGSLGALTRAELSVGYAMSRFWLLLSNERAPHGSPRACRLIRTAAASSAYTGIASRKLGTSQHAHTAWASILIAIALLQIIPPTAALTRDGANKIYIHNLTLRSLVTAFVILIQLEALDSTTSLWFKMLVDHIIASCFIVSSPKPAFMCWRWTARARTGG